MWSITEGLFLAQLPIIIGPTNKLNFERHKIKRVLTVTDAAIPVTKQIKDVEYVFVEMLDVESQEILGNGILEKCIQVVNQSLEKKENIVVHCVAAVSRSVTVCAAFLMFKNHWTMETAMANISQTRPAAGPNRGFIEQLKIFEKSNFDTNSNIYKNVKLEIPNSEDILFKHPVETKTDIVRYKCQKCRKLIFNEANVKHGAENCKKVVIEPMIWLEVADTTSTINHTCGAKLGNFNLIGSTCPSCGVFKSPWIAIDKSRIDRVAAL